MARYAGAVAEWHTCPGMAFTEHTGDLERGYPGERQRVDATRAPADPRFTHPESVAASVGPAATTAPFITFSGVPDYLILDPGLQPATFTFRDDVGRNLGSVSLSITSPGPIPMRCRGVDVTVPGATASIVSVTGYYEPHLRHTHHLQDDYTEEPNEAPNLRTES